MTNPSSGLPTPEYGVRPDELYDGPTLHLPKTTPQPRNDHQALKVLFDILSTRVLGLISVIAACVLWGFAVYEPGHERLLASAGFSVTVLLPIIVLYLKRG